ncbi:protein LLP homolog [Sergentomyia squamirostris]
MGRKRKAKNNNVKRERFAVKELARLKKCLGLIDEHGNEISKEIKEIATVTDAKSIKEKNPAEEDEMQIDETEPSSKRIRKVHLKNEKTDVVHVYNANTMKDQFGNYPVWYNRRAEKKKTYIKGRNNGGKSRKSRRYNLHTVTDPYKNLKY